MVPSWQKPYSFSGRYLDTRILSSGTGHIPDLLTNGHLEGVEDLCLGEAVIHGQTHAQSRGQQVVLLHLEVKLGGVLLGLLRFVRLHLDRGGYFLDGGGYFLDGGGYFLDGDLWFLHDEDRLDPPSQGGLDVWD